MKKSLLAGIAVLLGISGIPSFRANAVVIPPAMRGLSQPNPCQRVYDHLDQTSRSRPEGGVASLRFPPLALETVNEPDPNDVTKTVNRCRMYKLNQGDWPSGVAPDGNVIGVNRDGTQDDLGFVFTSAISDGVNLGISYFSYVVENNDLFENYDHLEFLGIRIFFPEIHMLAEAGPQRLAGNAVVPMAGAVADALKKARQIPQGIVPVEGLKEALAETPGVVQPGVVPGDPNVNPPADPGAQNLNPPDPKIEGLLKVDANPAVGSGGCSLAGNTPFQAGYIGFAFMGLGIFLARLRQKFEK